MATARLILSLCVLTATLCAQPQARTAKPGWPCVPGRAIDPAYVHTAEASGGQVFLFDRSEAARSMVLVLNTSRHEDTIYRAMGTLSTNPREFAFPVDSTVESLMLSVSLQCLQSITVFRPSSTEVHSGEPDVNENRFRSGLILILTKPEAGSWRVRIAGAGMFFAVAQAKSSISLDNAEFVAPGGRPGHEGLFPVKGPLYMGPQTLSVRLTAPPGETKFKLIDSEAKTLESLEMEPVSESGDGREFVHAFALKHPAFRVAVEGRDAGGYPYQRVLPRLMQAQPPKVTE